MNKTRDRINGFLAYRSLLRQLVIKNVKLKYRRSFLGYIWSVLNPLLIMCVMAVVFSTMFSRDIDNFPVYLFTGQILFNFMTQSTKQAIRSITGSASLLKKTYVPKYIFTLAHITSGLVDLLFSLGALVFVMLATGAKFSFYNLLFFVPILQLYVFSIGLGMFLGAANVFFRDIQYIYNAITTAWLYLTPIFYPIEQLPDYAYNIIVNFNPMYFYIGQFRALIYQNMMPDMMLVLKGSIAAVFMLAIGFYFFLKKQDDFILYI